MDCGQAKKTGWQSVSLVKSETYICSHACLGRLMCGREETQDPSVSGSTLCAKSREDPKPEGPVSRELYHR